VHRQIPRHSKGIRSYAIRAAKADRDADLWPFIQIALIEILRIQVKHIDLLAKQIIYMPKGKAGAREQSILLLALQVFFRNV
jgi:hypothetical protein